MTVTKLPVPLSLGLSVVAELGMSDLLAQRRSICNVARLLSSLRSSLCYYGVLNLDQLAEVGGFLLLALASCHEFSTPSIEASKPKGGQEALRSPYSPYPTVVDVYL
jgi:hypothetical protein